MSKGKRDALILTIIGLILYSLAYYNFVLVDALAQFNDVQSKIDVAEKTVAQLEDDFKNLATFERNLEIKNVQNERLEEYLMSEANLSDNIEYIDKLAKLFNNSFSTIKVGIPAAQVSKTTSTTYYQFAIDVDAGMTYSDAMSLVDYVEGGSRKVKISLFNLTPVAVGNTAVQNSQVPPQTQTGPTTAKYAVKMQINLYALNLANIDKVYEYSRKRFNKFDDGDGDGVIFVPNSTTISSTSGVNPGVNTGSASTSKVKQTIAEGLDIDIDLGSFLLSGQNFIIKGIGNQYPIKIKQKERASVKITFSDSGYHVNVIDVAGDAYNLSGKTKNDTIKMNVAVYFPLEIRENQKLGADIQIINNSQKRVDLNLEDKVKRVKITDRNGNVIRSRSETEKVYII